MVIDGKTALITGASSGIGAATARALAEAGARVLLVARRETELQQIARSVRPGAAAIFCADLSQAARGVSRRRPVARDTDRLQAFEIRSAAAIAAMRDRADVIKIWLITSAVPQG